MTPASLIETWFPAPAVGAESLRDAGGAKKPPVNRLHVWWARRPLAVSRAAVLATILPTWPTNADAAASDEAKQLQTRLESAFPGGEPQYRAWFLRTLGITGDPVEAQRAIDEARAKGIRLPKNPYGYPRAYTSSPDLETVELIRALAASNGDSSQVLRTLDPFAGGGAIPFEAARLGCESIANEINPVAGAVLEGTIAIPFERRDVLDLVGRYGQRWAEGVRTSLAEFFPTAKDRGPVASYIWAHAVPCPSTGHLTPLMPNHWLAKTGRKKVAVDIAGDAQSGVLDCTIVTGDDAEVVGGRSTYKQGTGVSVFTGETFSSHHVWEQAEHGKLSEVLIAVVHFGVKRGRGKTYHAPTDTDLAGVEKAGAYLAAKRAAWELDDLLPTEAIQPGHKTDEPRRMGLKSWAALFAPRQVLAHAIELRELHRVTRECADEDGEEAARVVALYLSFALSKGLNYNARLNGWHPTRESVANVFDRHDFAFKWTFAERPYVEWAIAQTLDALEGVVALASHAPGLDGDANAKAATIMRDSADRIATLEDASVDAIITDPPYYDNVMYAECSDYFYVWLKRALKDTWPEFCTLELTDKEHEAVANPSLFREVATARGPGKRTTGKTASDLATAHYEQLLAGAWRQAHRVLKDNGVMTVMFTHKRVDAWDTLGASLLDAGFAVQASWPVHTESDDSLHQARKNAASSTILLACRKRESSERAYWSDIRKDVADAARNAAARFSKMGLHGVDLTLSTFGPVLAVLSRNWPVYTGDLDEEGAPIVMRPDAALDLAREEVAKLKKAELLGGRDVDFDRPTDWYLLAWNDFQAAEFPSGEALKLSLATHLDLNELDKERRLVKTKSGTTTLLTPKQRRTARAFDLDGTAYAAMIDRLHALMVIYDEDGFRTAEKWLHSSGFRDDERFRDLVRAAINAIPRTKDKGAFVREEARILDSMRNTLWPDIPVPPDPVNVLSDQTALDV